MSISNTVIDEELQTIQSIFPDDFKQETTTTKAWKGASMPPSFTLRVASDDPELEPHVYLTLHVQYSKTYPISPATFTIKSPMAGITPENVRALDAEILKKSKELSRLKQEMVFDVRSLCVDYLNDKHTYQSPSVVKPESKKPMNSLATEMKARTESAIRAQKALADKEADGMRQIEEERAHRLEDEMQRDRQRREKKLQADQQRKKERERFLDREQDDTAVRFASPVKIDDVGFASVKVLMSHEGALGKVSMVEPVLDTVPASFPPLEMQSITFTSAYYTRSQGKKRLREIESELLCLRSLRHPNLCRVYAAELRNNHHDDHQTMYILTERPEALSLKDVLEQSDVIRPEKAVDYMIQILSALDVLATFQPESNHDRVKFCHRGICIACVGLRRDSSMKFGTRVQVNRAWYYGRLLNQHKSNSFNGTVYSEENPVPRQWMARDVEDAPHLYNQRRDIWDAGIIMLQMLLGVDVMTQYPAVYLALDSLGSLAISESLRKAVAAMFDQSKKVNLMCSDLIGRIRDAAREPVSKDSDSSSVIIPNGPASPHSPLALMRSPTAASRASMDYFSVSGSVNGIVNQMMPPPQTSRYKDEWEEIEFLGKGGFGSVVKARFKLDGAIYAVKKVKLKGENDGKIYREINALSRLNHRFIVRYHTTWIETTGRASGFESPTESGESQSRDRTNGNTPSFNVGLLPPARPRGLDFFREDISRGSFSGSINTTTSFPSIHFGHEDDEFSDEENDTEDAEDEDEDDADADEDDEEEGDGEEATDEDGDLTESMDPAGDESSGDSSTSQATPSVSRTPSRSRQNTPHRPHSLQPALLAAPPSPSPQGRVPQMLYIQMEYVERQTLKEAIEDGLSEKDGWRLFRQILEALAHMASLSIIHRDIKLTNIFIGANGDVKIGDFGLATSSLAGIDPSDVARSALQPTLEVTYGVGTALYTAPEVLVRSRGHANHSKADMYSLGIVFFEMCWPPFQTTAERIEVITKLRLPSVNFPDTWENRERQRIIISKLLRHNPVERPTASELSNSNLLPEQEEDAYFKEAIRKIQNSDEQCETFIAELFHKKLDDVKQLSYDIGATPSEQSSLNDIVQEHMEQLFRLHGAVHKEPLLLIPLTEVYDDEQQPVRLLDSAGRPVFLPRDHILGFARLSIPSKDTRTPLRVKRFHIGNTYLPSPTGKQPIPRLMAAVDIVHTDQNAGAAEAELIRIASESLNLFPGVGTQHYDIHISHSSIIEHVFNKITGNRKDIVMVLSQAKPWSQKRAHLSKLGIPRIIIDEMEILTEDIDDVADLFDLVERLEKVSGVPSRLATAVEEVTRTINLAKVMGVGGPIIFRPFIMLDQTHFRDGILFEVRTAKRGMEPIARGGRYDHLIAKFAGISFKSTRAIGMSISLEPLISALAENLSVTVPRMIKDQRSFGYWSPSRCDVYVVSFQTGLLAERIELTAMLWQQGIRADVMYESAIESNPDPIGYVNQCSLEGILFMVWYRPKTARRDHGTYKVKSILRKTEHEVSLQELVPWLTAQIAEQRRSDLSHSGSKGALLTPSIVGTLGSSSVRDASALHGPDVQVIVSGNSYTGKYQKHKAKVHHAERAYAIESELRASISSGLPVIAVEASSRVLDALTANTSWVSSDAAWKTLLADLKDEFPSNVAQQLREVVVKKSEGSGQSRMVGLMSLKGSEERIFLIRI